MMSSDSSAEFHFFQAFDNKAVSLLKLPLVLGDEEEINNHVIYKH
jgi:hypothetical protein